MSDRGTNVSSWMKTRVGDTHGDLTVVSFELGSRAKLGRLPKMVVKCSCGEVYETPRRYWRNFKLVGHCGCRAVSGPNHPKWTGVGELSGHEMARFRNGCKRGRGRVLAFSVTAEYLWSLFLSQGRRCALSGRELRFGVRPTASLDRIDSSKGYVPGNVQWLHKVVNRAKSDQTDEDFIRMCREICVHRA